MAEAAVHALAAVDPGAKLGSGVEIGPFAVIGPNVTLGDRVKIHSHAVVTGITEVGDACEIHPFAVVGGKPQDMKYRGEESRLIVGPHSTIREHVTMNGGTEGAGQLSRAGLHGDVTSGCHQQGAGDGADGHAAAKKPVETCHADMGQL